MIISVRLNENDYSDLLEINNKINEEWSNIFLIDDPTTISQTIRACIRRTHFELFEKESNKMDNT